MFLSAMLCCFLYPLLTGRENLRYHGLLYGLSRAEADHRVRPMLE